MVVIQIQVPSRRSIGKHVHLDPFVWTVQQLVALDTMKDDLIIEHILTGCQIEHERVNLRLFAPSNVDCFHLEVCVAVIMECEWASTGDTALLTLKMTIWHDSNTELACTHVPSSPHELTILRKLRTIKGA